MSNDLWRWADPDGQQRKVRFDELRAALAGGLIAPNTPVWREGWNAWQPAHDVPELTSASLGGANGVVLNIPPPPLAMVAVQQQYEASSDSIVPPATNGRPEAEPPPPPPYVPIPAKTPSIHPSADNLKTQLGGSAYVPAAPGSAPSVIGPAPAPTPRAAPSTPRAAGSAPRVGPSLPTTIGLPAPPELLAAASAAARPKSVRPPPMLGAEPMRPLMNTPTADPEMIEELSGSMLLDSASSPDLGIAAASADGDLPPPTEPVVRGAPEATPAAEEEIAGLPRRPGLSLILDDIAEIRQGRPPKNKLVLAVVGALGLCVVIMLIAGIVSIFSGPSSSSAKDAVASASAKTTAAPPASTAAALARAPATTAAPPPPEAKNSPSFGDCTATGEAKPIAPRALIASGIEAQALGSGLAIGFAAGPRDAVAISLDPSSLAPASTVRARPNGGDARRVTPVLVGGKLTALADVDHKGDHLSGRRVVATSSLIDIGTADGGIAWAPHGRDSLAKLFSLDGEGAVEALRAIARSEKKGIAIAFRRGNTINVGAAKGESVLDADGELATISGLGQVGSPALSASGDRLIVAWADRAGTSDDWTIRWTKLTPGSSPDDAMTFSLPEGGLGGHAMSPSIAPLGGGRFLLAWTEGPVSNHQVRAITMNADGTPSGTPIAISPSGVNAGQPAAVVGPDGRGAIAFLAAKGKALEVQATPISCTAR